MASSIAGLEQIDDSFVQDARRNEPQALMALSQMALASWALGRQADIAVAAH